MTQCLKSRIARSWNADSTGTEHGVAGLGLLENDGMMVGMEKW